VLHSSKSYKWFYTQFNRVELNEGLRIECRLSSQTFMPNQAYQPVPITAFDTVPGHRLLRVYPNISFAEIIPITKRIHAPYRIVGFDVK
jgi:hypothetical protein